MDLDQVEQNEDHRPDHPNQGSSQGQPATGQIHRTRDKEPAKTRAEAGAINHGRHRRQIQQAGLHEGQEQHRGDLGGLQESTRNHAEK